MSQGIFGAVNFQRRIENPMRLASCMGEFLESENSAEASMSYELGSHFILGMKRICEASYQAKEIAHDRESKLFGLIHGEINNCADLQKISGIGEAFSKGDLKGLLEIYKSCGPTFPKLLNGLFCIVVLNEREPSLLILNDRFGMAHQVYWTVVNGTFYFATHLRTLMRVPEIPRNIDHEGLNLFLKYSYIPSPWTIFKGIRKLPPGCLLRYKNGATQEEVYWNFPRQKDKELSLEDAASEYRRLMLASILRRLESKGDVGILLSGGLDSGMNVALASECSGRKLRTFSIGFDDPAFDERPFARMVARHFDTEHSEYVITGKEIDDLPKLVWNLEEPYFEFGLFLTYLGMAAAKKEVDVIIGGEGADQLYGTGGFVKGMPLALRYLFLRSGLIAPLSFAARRLKGDFYYNRDNLAFKGRLMLSRVADLNDWYFYGYDQNELDLLHKNSMLSRVPRIFPVDGSRPSSYESLYLEAEIDQDIKHYANENVMVKSGRMADMLDLTLRESYLDPEVTDFIVSLPYRFKRQGDLLDHLRGKVKTKYLHRETAKEILPPEVLVKPKQGGFVPVMIFLKDRALRESIYRRLEKSEAIDEYFNPEAVKAVFANYEQNVGKKIYWHNFYNSKANRILFLLTFDLWHHFYIANNPIDAVPPTLSEYL
ncbi:MAG: asparagine synthase [Deltaproteobacteria bacterium]|nr:asparagine synthase [Deltaproteobacteria bacterium]